MIKIPGTPEGVPGDQGVDRSRASTSTSRCSSPSTATKRRPTRTSRGSRSAPPRASRSTASPRSHRSSSRASTTRSTSCCRRGSTSGEHLEHLLGKAAIANTKLAYQRFLKLFGGDRFGALKAKGAHVQRPLWASTSTKNPAYPDLMYVENLVGRDTVNTVPPNTLEALLDHGHVRADTVLEELDRARAVIEALAKSQISLYDVTEQLVADGVTSFADSFTAMLDAIKGKLEQLRQGAPPRVALALGQAGPAADGSARRARVSATSCTSSGRTTPRRGRATRRTSRSSSTHWGGSRSRSRRTRRAASCASSRWRARSASTTSSCSGWAAARSRPTCCARPSARRRAFRRCTCSTRPTRSRSRRSTTASTSRARSSSSPRNPARPPSPTRSSATSTSACSRRSASRTPATTSSRSPIPARSSSRKPKSTSSCASSPTIRTSAGATPRSRTSGWCRPRWRATTSRRSSTARSTRCTPTLRRFRTRTHPACASARRSAPLRRTAATS